MNQKLLSGLTAALLITNLGTVASSYAGQPEAVDPGAEATQPTASTPTPAHADSQSTDAAKVGERQSQVPETHAIPKGSEATSSNALTRATPSTPEVMKVGERQSQASPEASSEVVAKIYPHVVSGHQAATLYVRNIPVLTFLSDRPVTAQDTKLGTTDAGDNQTASAQTKALSRDDSGAENATAPDSAAPDPVWRATAVAAMLNQLNRENLDASKINVSWRSEKDASGKERDRYLIKIDGKELVALDPSVVLPDSTRNPETDALQATNRLRRLLGNAPALQEISGKPNRTTVVAFGPVRLSLNGWASWYGPGFHGSPSASGEIFNENALTAAHRSLPFGTQVRVTNLDNGRSVIVRINDRGPYAGDRVIDLSAAAARVIGLMQSGIAPVRLDVVDTQTTASAGN